MSLPPPIIELSHVSKIYHLDGVEVKAVDDVSLKIEKGDFTAIMGPSGSGKSTIMHLLGLLDKPTFGEVKIEGKNVEKLNENELAVIRNQKIGFIFQSFNLLPKTSSLNNVELTLVYSKINTQNRTKLAKEMLIKVGLENRLHHFPSQLSGGQQQRVAIARALINNPLLIIADEPTGNLDSKSSQEIISLLKDLNAKDHTIIMVTHEPDVAKEAKKIVRIKDGKIVNF